MVMIESFLGMARYLSPRQDDDAIDRLHYLVTANILLAFSVLISWKQFGGQPIECMFPSKFPGSWEQYAENYCWSESTYFVEPKRHVELMKDDERNAPDRKLSYYQWVPFFLILQAVFFRAPSYLWRHFSNHSGLRIHEIVSKARDPANVEDETKNRNVQILSKHIQKAMRFQRRMLRKKVIVHKTFTCLNYQYSSGFITSIYILTKIVYLANVAAQFWLLNYFLGTSRHSLLGFGVLHDLMHGIEWDVSGYFPRSVICDFEVRQVANFQKYSVQCVLVINLFNQYIFMLLWFWYLFLTGATLLSLLQWFTIMAFPCFSRWFVSQHMELSSVAGFDPNSKKSTREVARFVHEYLHRDGVFVLRMVCSHAGVIFTTDLIHSLWRSYYGIEASIIESPEDGFGKKNALVNFNGIRNRKIKSENSPDNLRTNLVRSSDEESEGENQTTPFIEEKHRKFEI